MFDISGLRSKPPLGEAYKQSHFMFVMMAETELPLVLDFMEDRLLPVKAVVPCMIGAKGPDGKIMHISAVRVYSQAAPKDHEGLREEFAAWHRPIVEAQERERANKIVTVTPGQAAASGLIM